MDFDYASEHLDNTVDQRAIYGDDLDEDYGSTVSSPKPHLTNPEYAAIWNLEPHLAAIGYICNAYSPEAGSLGALRRLQGAAITPKRSLEAMHIRRLLDAGPSSHHDLQFVGNVLGSSPHNMEMDQIGGQHADRPSAAELENQTPTETETVELDLFADFPPSKELLAIWSHSLIELYESSDEVLLSEIDISEAIELLRKPNDSFRKQFHLKLKAIISDFAQIKRYDTRSFFITLNKRLLPTLQVRLVEDFLITPDRGSEFLGLLVRELIAFTRKGQTIRGGWGRLLHHEGELKLELERDPTENIRGFKQAETERF